MRKVGLLLLVLLLTLGSCGAPVQSPKEGVQIYATLFPQYDFARTIGAEEVSVHMLLPAGAEPHHYEPTPKDLAALSEADLLLYTGEGMEPWVARIASSAKDLQLIDVSRGVTLLHTLEEEEDHGHEHEEEVHDEHAHDHEGADPHIWTSLDNARVMAKNVLDALIEVAPEHAALFTSRWEAYDAQLSALDEAYLRELSELSNRTLLYGGHFAFGYLAERYGLTHRSPYAGYSSDAEPTPADMARLIDALREENAHTLFYEELSEPRIARSIASETGADLVLLHGAHNLSAQEWSEGKTYLSIMQENLEKLLRGLQ